MHVLDPLYQAVAWIIVHIHSGLDPIMGEGAAWALSIVLLTIAMRLVLFPLFVKQIKTQRAMQVLAPKVKELQAKYKNDRERLNTEMMALYREHGANPLSGCLPLLLQIPIFIALFHVLNAIKPDKAGHYKAILGMSEELVRGAAQAKVFGVPVAAAFNSSAHTLDLLHANATNVKVLTTLMIVLMGLSTFFTQRQMIARTGAEGAAATQQKVLLYILPFTFGIFGFRFPLGVLLYWLTTNIWSMGQQFFVIRRMPVPAGGPGAGGAAARASRPAPRPPATPATQPAREQTGAPAAAPSAVGARRPAAPRAAGAPRSKRRSKRRR